MANVDVPLLLKENCALAEVETLSRYLHDQGTFHFPTLRNGLFSAAAGDGGDFELTGYRNVWVRDNVHIAHAHWQWGESDKAVAAVKSLMAFFLKYQQRFADIIDGRVDASDPMNRPHVRFDGDRLVELDEKWSHAQNDALGAFLWLATKLTDACRWNQQQLGLLESVARYLVVIRFWHDEDSGHWEEVRKIAASSIGVATAALDVWSMESGREFPNLGRQSLESILPAECVQADPQKRREFDSALLFLIYPYQIVQGEMADRIVRDVTTHLMGEHGIRRYLGDSYWCADYKEKLSANVRTADFSDNIASRDRFLEPGLEAQWCLFDPIVSIHYGIRYERTRDMIDRRQQLFHLNRSLSQLTRPGSRFGAFRCPESYFREQGEYVPNDICPLLWTQANLKLALTHLIQSLKS